MAQHLPEDDCARAMEGFRNQTTCEWCHHPREPVMARTRKCKHCNRIRRELERLEAEDGGRETYDLRVQRAMAEDCQFEGRQYGHFFDDELIPLGLEREFRRLSERFVGENFFNGMATALNHSFSLNQRRYLFFLLSLMNRKWMRKNRRRNAMMTAILDDAERPRLERP